uniref:CUB domain-containing protein n=1 Tax=Anopheles culicifacies TaxID=139723 RepID=A0A182LZA5_9DIPT
MPTQRLTSLADLTCKDTKQSVGALMTKTNFLTFKYVTDNWGTETNGFKMVITSVKDSKLNCADFRCRLPDFCIHQDLRCDGINHCADGSDETVEANCPGPDRYINTIFGIELTWVILIGVSSLTICGCIVGITICVYVRNARNTPNQLNSSIQFTTLKLRSSGYRHLM